MPTGSVLQLVTVFLLLILVIALAYVATRWIAGFQKQKGANLNIEVIETLRIAPGKFIAIIRIGTDYHAIAIGKDETTYLTAVNGDALTIRTPAEAGGMGFSELFRKLKEDRNNRGED